MKPNDFGNTMLEDYIHAICARGYAVQIAYTHKRPGGAWALLAQPIAEGEALGQLHDSLEEGMETLMREVMRKYEKQTGKTRPAKSPM